MIPTQEKQSIVSSLKKNTVHFSDLLYSADVTDVQEIKEILLTLKVNIDKALSLFNEQDTKVDLPDPQPIRSGWKPRKSSRVRKYEENALRIIEGVFDGEHMIGSDGKRYLVPTNYASKSKLVEGDILKLVIGQEGNFTYKQISPIERQRMVGTLSYNEDLDHYFVENNKKSWKVLAASVSYFDGEHGDEVVCYVPKNSVSSWAAVETIIPSGADDSVEMSVEDEVIQTIQAKSEISDPPITVSVLEMGTDDSNENYEDEEIDLETLFDPFADEDDIIQEGGHTPTGLRLAFELGLQKIDSLLKRG